MFSIDIISDPNEILKYLQIGINLPILPQFHKYLLKSFDIFKSKAILLKKKEKVIGICLVFEEEDILFFGFFGVINDDPENIELLIDYLLKYATKCDHRYVRGPVNVPAIIYGYGFSAATSKKEIEISDDNFFIACPISSSRYLQTFLKKGFYEKYQEDFFYMPIVKLNPLKLKYDYSDYEVIFPGKEKISNYISDVLKLHMELMPSESSITPNSPQYAKIIVDFIYDFGMPWMIWLVKHKPTNRIVGEAHIAPNVFGEKDDKYGYTTASFQHAVVDKEHQRRGLLLYLYGMGTLKAKDKKSGNNIKYGLGIAASNNKPSVEFIKKVGGQLFIRNIILEYKL